jgi:hypothetical protein
MPTGTRDRAAPGFILDTLGLTMTGEGHFAALFDIGGVVPRVSTVADFLAPERTVGFHVSDVDAAVGALRQKGGSSSGTTSPRQGDLGILRVPVPPHPRHGARTRTETC